MSDAYTTTGAVGPIHDAGVGPYQVTSLTGLPAGVYSIAANVLLNYDSCFFCVDSPFTQCTFVANGEGYGPKAAWHRGDFGVVAMLATASFDADDNTITVQCFDYHERDINKYSADIIAMRVGQRHVQ